MNFNDRLIDRDYISRVNYENKVYVTRLFHAVYDLLKELPIPVIASYDPKNVQIYFMFVDNKKSFTIDDEISIPDYLTLIRRWSSRFFPSYMLKTTEEVALSKDEVFDKVKKDKIKIEDAIDLTKEIEVVEAGVIDSIYLSEDLFRMNINGLYSIYTSENSMDLSKLLETLKDIKPDEERKDFIFKNSMEIVGEEPLRFVYEKVSYFRVKSSIAIDYVGKKMYNFFSINYPNLRDEELIEVDNLRYEWGKYEIRFEDNDIEEMCVDYVDKKRVV